MKVILLAAGYGTRLYPLTENTPKALLSINGKTILDRILDSLDNTEVYLVTNNKFYTHFTEYSDRYLTINDHTTCNEDRLGAVGDIMHVIHEKEINEDVLIINTDNLFGCNLETFIDHAQDNPYSVAACKEMCMDSVRNRFGVVVHKNKVITEFQEKPDVPKSSLASVGLYYIKHKDLPLIAECAKMSADNTGDMIKHLVLKSKVTVWSFTEDWSDVGTLESFQDAQHRF